MPLIICGYPGVGKSSLAGWNNCIDLESSLFSYRDGCAQKTMYWVPQYCQAAIDLALQGYTVFTSTHRAVIEYLKEPPMPLKGSVKTVIFCPDHRYKLEWIDRLQKRLERDDRSLYSKNKRALDRVIEHFDEDMDYLNNCGLPVHIPAYIDYDFKEYVQMLQIFYEERRNNHDGA